MKEAVELLKNDPVKFCAVYGLLYFIDYVEGYSSDEKLDIIADYLIRTRQHWAKMKPPKIKKEDYQ